MIDHNLNLKELIQTCDPEKVYMYLWERDVKMSTNISIDIIRRQYSSVIEELINNKPSTPYYYRIHVNWDTDPFAFDGRYIHVSFDACDTNDLTSGVLSKWSEMLSMPVINEAGLSNEGLLAEILWEITFYGFTEKASVDTVESFLLS